MPKKRVQKSKISRRRWEALPSSQQEVRERALSVLARMRQGALLYPAAQEVGIDPRTAVRHLEAAITKRAGKYLARKTDRISRGMIIYSDGKQVQINVNDSRTASTIGKYFNAVRQLLNAGDKEALHKFTNVSIIDENGVSHQLESKIKNILAIEERKEDGEAFEIYGRG